MKKNLFESEKNPCYERHVGMNGSAAPMDCLRLEPNPKCFWLLSYHHLEFAAFESAQGEDIITMSFLNRTVRIKGKNLRELGLALQHHTVEFIKPLPERYLPLSGDADEVLVKTVEINDRTDGD